MKRVLIVSLLLAFLIIPSVSAFYIGNVEFAVRDLLETVRQFFAPILEVLVGDYSSSEFFFAKVLLMVLLFMLVQFAMKRIPSLEGQKAVINVVSVVVSILSIRYIQDNDLFNLILLPYGALGIALTAIIPFLIYFYFVHNATFGPAGRRFAWIFFIIIFLSLWWTRSDVIGQIGNQIFGWTLAAVALALVFDGSIHKYFSLHDLHLFEKSSKRRRLLELQNRYIALESNYSREAHEEREHIRKELKKLKED